MDIKEKGVLFVETSEVTKNGHFGDTTLQLNCFGHEERNMTRFGNTRSSHGIGYSDAPDDDCRLVLALGPTPTAYSDDYPKVGLSRNKPSLLQGMLSESGSVLKLGQFRETVAGLGVLNCSVSTLTDINVPHLLNQGSVDDNRLFIPVVDEGSTSAKRSGGYMPILLMGPRMDSSNILFPSEECLELRTESDCLHSQLSPEPSVMTEYSMGTVSKPVASGASSGHRTNNPKKCMFPGCSKGARGASGLCIGHGGGQRCQKEGCSKGAESRTAYCKAHGGGRRCEQLGCTKSAEGKTDYCIAHGGGKRCGYPGDCTKAARGKSGLCIRHGGGKRCKVEGCTRSAEGQAGLCISHGGGRRCQYQGCTKGAQGSTMFCKAHGGGKRCIFAGCTKGAEGSTPLCKGHGGGKRCLYDGGGICPKSVHGGTNFCVAHGGGKRCAVPSCTKSARGRTDCCVRHGGGRRCHFDNCGKSAQGSTDFCKAHGGGKRCAWKEGEEGKCEKFARGRSGLCAAHTSVVQERETNKQCMIRHGLFDGLVAASASTAGSSFDNDYSSSGVSVVSDSIDSQGNPGKQQYLTPPQVLVPLSMKSPQSGLLGAEKQEGGNNGCDIGRAEGGKMSLNFVIPEGRVHGGGLMSLFGGNLNNAIGRI